MRTPLARGNLISTGARRVAGAAQNADAQFAGDDLSFSISILFLPTEMHAREANSVEVYAPFGERFAQRFRRLVEEGRILRLFDGGRSVGEIRELHLLSPEDLSNATGKAKRLLQSVITPLARYTFPMVVGVYGVKSAREGELWASGVRVLSGTSRTILTSARVFREGITRYSGLAVSVGTAAVPYLIHGTIRFDSLQALAIYAVPDDYSQQRDAALAFWTSDRVGLLPGQSLDDGILFLHGYAKGNSSFDKARTGVASRSFPYASARSLDEAFAQNRDYFAIEFGKVESVAIDPTMNISAAGLEGSPVWLLPVPTRGDDWTLNDARLIGIVTDYLQDKELLIARLLRPEMLM